MHYDSKLRSVLKSISWRFCATITTAVIVFVITGRVDIALIVSGIEVVVKIVIYFLHERLWDKIKFGKKH